MYLNLPESERVDLELRQAHRGLAVMQAGVERRRALLALIETALIEGQLDHDAMLSRYFPPDWTTCPGCAHSCAPPPNPHKDWRDR